MDTVFQIQQEYAEKEIEFYRNSSPDVVSLALLASPARKIEPELLRTLRLELANNFPLKEKPHVGTESALWFSDLVESRGADSITLLPGVSNLLRCELKKKHGALLENIRQIILECHRSVPPVIAWEEDLVYYSLISDGADEYQRLVYEAVLKAAKVVQTGERKGLDEWINRMYVRVPSELSGNPNFKALLSISQQQIIKTPELTDAKTNLAASDDVVLGIKRFENHIEIGKNIAAADFLIHVPNVFPINLIVSNLVNNQKEICTIKGTEAAVLGYFEAEKSFTLQSTDGRIYKIPSKDQTLSSAPEEDALTRLLNNAIINQSNRLELTPKNVGRKLTSEDLINLIPEITWLENLTALDLSYNNLTEIGFLGELKSLHELNLEHNQISDASFLGELKSLTSLYLSDNRISDISFIRELKSLSKLGLSRNQISDVSSFGELKSLHQLDLSNNKIRDASFLRELKSLTTLYINDNPELNLPGELKDESPLQKEGIDKIIKYYEQLEREGKDYIYEAKILIIGEPGAGKTTLFRKLQSPNYSPREATYEEKESTIGVNIEILEFPFDEEKTFKAHLWDFGGQEMHYVLHQYFFTERSLYILVADDRRHLGNFNYWFEIIATLGNGCPVLVVLNEINSKVRNFDISVYRKEFGAKIQDIEEKSVDFAKSDGRFENLVNEIKTKLRNLPHIGHPLPKTWVKVRKALTKIGEPIITIDDYEKICMECGVESVEYRQQILEYLHDLGVALNYRHDMNLRNRLILKPNWVIDALYAVLKDKQIIRNAGKFTAEEVFDLWSDYKSDEKTILLHLMQKGKFEVAYKLEGKNAYIAPILLPEIAPKYDFNETDSLQIHFEYAFKPKGIISRLIVRFYPNIVVNEIGEQFVWKKGVLLKNGNSTARVVESEQQRKIVINVSGKDVIENRALITAISNEIKQIHRDWFEDRLQFEEKIPCYCDVCKTSNETQFYGLEAVEMYYQINQEIICDKSLKARRLQRVNPRILLEGVYIEKNQENVKDFEKNIFQIAGNLNISTISGENNVTIQGLKDSHITSQSMIVDEISSKMNESQRQTMESLSNEIISRTEDLREFNDIKETELEEIKKGKWETKLKFSLPFIPIEFSRTISSDEFISKIRKWLYGSELKIDNFQGEEEIR